MSICPSCQAENPDTYQFCQFCGTKISVDIVDIADISVESTIEPAINISEEEKLISLQEAIPVASDTEKSPEELVLEDSSIQTDSEDVADVSLDIVDGTHSITDLQDLTYAAKTDVGRQRDRNEDDFVATCQIRNTDRKGQICDRSYRGLFVLCDGMGGHEGGAEASAIAVNAIAEQFEQFWIDTLPGERKLNEIICIANQEIFAKNEAEQRQVLGRMGTTLVLMAIHNLEVAIAHVGDSRIYKITNSSNLPLDNSDSSLESISPKLEQITRDHEVLNQLLDRGVDLESALARPDSHQLTQALGPNSSDFIEPTINFFTLTEPTLFLLCSDGLCDNDAIEQNWLTHLLPILNKEINLQTGLDNLIDLGNNVNGYDNLTAILVLCEPAAIINVNE
jgi:serine/threonine protein phosphatase PrpC